MARFKIGDKVSFLNETGYGHIARFKDKNTVIVEIESGMEIPYPMQYLVPIHVELIVDNDAEDLEEQMPENQVAESIFFVIEPDHELPLLQDNYSIYLFNYSSFNLMFTYSIRDHTTYQTLKNGEIGPFQKLMLKKIAKKEIMEFEHQKIECLFYKNTHYVSQIPIAQIIKLTPQLLEARNFISNPSFKFPVIAIALKDDFIESRTEKIKLTDYDVNRLKAVKDFGAGKKNSTKSKKTPSEIIEVDLHIDELTDQAKNMGNYEMLQLQLKIFQQNLEKAIAEKAKKIVFIHGVGNGRLKQEITTILKGYSEVSFHDGSYKNYGYGATEVVIH